MAKQSRKRGSPRGMYVPITEGLKAELQEASDALGLEPQMIARALLESHSRAVILDYCDWVKSRAEEARGGEVSGRGPLSIFPDDEPEKGGDDAEEDQEGD